MGSLVTIILSMSMFAFVVGQLRAISARRASTASDQAFSHPIYGGLISFIWCAIPCLLLLLVWTLAADTLIHQRVINSLPNTVQMLSSSELELVINQIDNLNAGYISPEDSPAYVAAAANLQRQLEANSNLYLSIGIVFCGVFFCIWAWWREAVHSRARLRVESVFEITILGCASLAVLTTAGILFSVLFESLKFFQQVPITEFFFSTEWTPMTALRTDQVGGAGNFGVLPILLGTVMIALLALLVAVPVGLLSAIYLAEYASSQMRTIVKPTLEILAGIPTVVYGFFAALTVAPMIRFMGEWLTTSWAFELMGVSVQVSAESALAAGLVMGVMIIPFISSLTDDVLLAVPRSLKEGALALGATRSEMIKQVLLPAALPGFVAGVLLAASRAIGETMIVVMAAGLAARLSVNPLDSMTTITVQIVTLLSGDQVFDSPRTLSAFALGLLLFLITLLLNIFALRVVRRYRGQVQ